MLAVVLLRLCFVILWLGLTLLLSFQCQMDCIVALATALGAGDVLVHKCKYFVNISK